MLNGPFCVASPYTLIPSQVFDAELTGRYFAYHALWGDSHAASFRNIQYYFNPFTFKMEPIPFDSNAYSSKRIRFYPNNQRYRDHEITRLLLNDSAIANAYIEGVEEFYGFAHGPDFEKQLRRIEDQYLPALREEFWLLTKLNLTSMKESIGFTKDKVDSGAFYHVTRELINDQDDPSPLNIPDQYRAPEVIQANLVSDNDRDILEIHNLFPLTAQITSLNISVDGKPSKMEAHLTTSLPITIDPFYYNQYFNHTDIPLRGLPKDKEIEIGGTVRLTTQEQVDYRFRVGKTHPRLEQHPLVSQTADQITSRYPFLTYSHSETQFEITAGVWHIDTRIIFPEKASLKIGPGVELLFGERAGMLVKGKVSIADTQGSPVIFDSTEQKPGSVWAGFTVMQADLRSELNYTEFRHTGYTQSGHWRLTGGVTFYQSDVDIRNTSFVATEAEDALNIVHSNFTISDSTIEGSRSDGFDGDFATGSITNSRFSNIGGDGIDFSGSYINIENSYFDNIHDKAISAGEESHLSINRVEVVDSGTGLAVKDGSVGAISNSKFENIKYAS